MAVSHSSARQLVRVLARSVLGAMLLSLAACEKEPPDLPSGHIAWLDGSGALRMSLRAKPYGFRIGRPDGKRWGRIERDDGGLRLLGPKEDVVVARRTAQGAELTDPAGALRLRLREAVDGLVLLDRAAAPLGRIATEGGRATAYSPGGLPLGMTEIGSGPPHEGGDGPPAVLLRGRSQAVVGTVLGRLAPEAAALLLLDDIPLEDRLALVALFLER